MKSRILISVLLPLLIMANSCMDDDAWYAMNYIEKKNTILNNTNSKQDGVFILNEGNFMYDNASLSYYNIGKQEILNEIFLTINDTPLGDVAQSMEIRDSLAYIVLNNSRKVYVINMNTFEFTGKITGLISPRYIHFIDDTKAYITDLYANAITIVNPQTCKITGYIDVHNAASQLNQHSTEQMLQYKNFVFTNCWSYDNKILIIDTETDQLVDSIEVPLQPNSMVLDAYQNLWVLCDGGFEGNPAGNVRPELIQIDPESYLIEKEILFDLNSHPIELNSNGTGDTLYFINKDIYRYIVNSDSDPEIFIKSQYTSNLTGGFYSIGIDPFSGEVYVADAIDQVQRGVVYRYRPDGQIADTFKTGISPGYFCFKPE